MENIGRTLSDINCSKIFFDPPPIVMKKKKKNKNNKWGLIKLKSFFTAKETIKKKKRWKDNPQMEENICKQNRQGINPQIIQAACEAQY